MNKTFLITNAGNLILRKEQKWILFLALEKQYFLGYLKTLYLDHFTSTYLCVILKTTYFTGCANDNTPFEVRDSITFVIKALEKIVENLVNWFSNNKMKLNTDKCHLPLESQDTNALKICDLHVYNSLSQKILNVKFDCKLRFWQTHRRYLLKSIPEDKRACKACTIHGSNKNILVNSFFTLQFSYCPLVWTFCNRSLNTKMPSDGLQ